MTPEMAAKYLQEGNVVVRTFGEVLREMYPHPDLQLRLTNALVAYELESAPESVTRKVANWLCGRSQPMNREDVFRIAFALDLTEGQLDYLLGQCLEYGIHYRNGRDVIYAWFLRNDYGYMDARNFYDSLPPVPQLFPEDSTTQVAVQTRELQRIFAGVRTVDELRTAYTQNLSGFGQLHVRAYQYFEKYMRQLMHPDTPYGESEEEDYSLEAEMEQYLSLQMPTHRSRSGYTVVQKLLKKNWPNTTTLKNIHAHKADVPRKLLLILYVVTENIIDEDYNENDEDYLTMEERLENHWWMLNAILIDCGMPTLDPRNVTDWLVLYALTAGDDESMSERMAGVIEQLYLT